jgi:hypothetical protein
MSIATHDLTHATDMVARLLSFLKGKPNLTALLGCYAAEVQAAEDALWQLLTQRYALSTPPSGQSMAQGNQLDGIGDIVVQSRGGAADADYILQLLAKITLNSASGRINDLISLVQLLNAGLTVRLVQAYPASFLIYVSAPISNGSTQGSIVRSATAAGVASELVATTAAAARTFTVTTSVAPVGTASLIGFGDSRDPTIGGYFASTY